MKRCLICFLLMGFHMLAMNRVMAQDLVGESDL